MPTCSRLPSVVVLLAVFFLVSVGESAAQHRLIHVEQNAQEQFDPILDFDNAGVDASTDTYVRELPRNGVVIKIEDSSRYVYVPNDGFVGFDRFSVAAMVDGDESEIVYHVTVGELTISVENTRLDPGHVLLSLLLLIVTRTSGRRAPVVVFRFGPIGMSSWRWALRSG